MVDPIFWLGFSLLLVAVSLTAVLVAALPALRELARAARSAEKLFDTLSRELPPTLEAIRLTGLEITDLTDDVSEGVQNAGRVAQQIDQSLSSVRKQARQAQVTSHSVVAGFKAAWRSLTRPTQNRRGREGAGISSARNFPIADAAGVLPTDLRNLPEEVSNRLSPNVRSRVDREEPYGTSGDFYHYGSSLSSDDSFSEELEEELEDADEFRNSSTAPSSRSGGSEG